MKTLLATAVVTCFLSCASGAEAALIFYADFAAFDAANPGLPVEDFENANGDTQSFTGPLDSSTNNLAFSPGDILAGITFVDNPGPDDEAMFIAGPGQSSNPTTAIGQNFPNTDALDILLNPGVTAVSFQIFQNFGGGSQSGQDQLYPVDVFGSGGLLGSTNVLVPSGGAGFFGVSSTIAGEIVRVSVNHEGAFDVIDNVRFGDGQVPEPASLTMLGLALAALARARRRA